MDIATIGGIVVGMAMIIIAIMKRTGIGAFIDVESLLIVLGGTIAATFVNYPLPQVLSTFKVVRKALGTHTYKPEDTIAILVSFAEKARREGLLALEAEADKVDESFLKKGIELIVDGTDPELVRSIMETELSFIEERHGLGAQVFDRMGESAPAFGMVGTLIGLIAMLASLDDPSTIGPAMAVALITTFYGSLFANLIFIPIAGKLKIRSREEVLNKELMIEGVLSIQAGENPRIVAEKMKSFLNPADRAKLDKKGADNE